MGFASDWSPAAYLSLINLTLSTLRISPPGFCLRKDPPSSAFTRRLLCQGWFAALRSRLSSPGDSLANSEKKQVGTVDSRPELLKTRVKEVKEHVLHRRRIYSDNLLACASQQSVFGGMWPLRPLLPAKSPVKFFATRCGLFASTCLPTIYKTYAVIRNLGGMKKKRKKITKSVSNFHFHENWFIFMIQNSFAQKPRLVTLFVRVLLISIS